MQLVEYKSIYSYTPGSDLDPNTMNNVDIDDIYT